MDTILSLFKRVLNDLIRSQGNLSLFKGFINDLIRSQGNEKRK